uniref:3-deoxy-7-phosphoheptulonate synthase n=1 Tax=Acanthamoeba castellanii TaxID=5755 RepID=M9TIJ6_ACACA|nr:3-deoxy-D-arabinoheptulosonate 7-phosphate synthase [Acanthamoeba castellanii]
MSAAAIDNNEGLLDDVRVTELRPLIPPSILIEELPVTPNIAATVRSARSQAARIVRRRPGELDDRLLVVVGPCSIHDPSAAIEYAKKLKEEAERLKDDLCIIMRVYFEKPRTTVGWKGLINDPFLDSSYQINKGLRIARGLLCELNEMGVPAAVEFLDTISPQFVADLVSWGAIGARTTESQVHRELASGLSVPVGFKNGTDGGVQVALDAIKAASNPHQFLGVTKQGLTAIVRTRGNDACHIVLRGGKGGPNYDGESVQKTVELARKAKLSTSIMIDCSHDNSRKNHANQPVVSAAIAEQVAAGCADIIGVMIESNLVEGRQDLPADGPQYLQYGKSITDACISFKDTVPVLESLAAAVRERRKKTSAAAAATTNGSA